MSASLPYTTVPPDDPSRLSVVVDPCYGERLKELSSRHNVWVVDSDVNKSEFQHLSQSGGSQREHRDLTCFSAVNSEDRLSSLVEVLPALVNHYGVVSGDYLMFPQGFIVKVIGLRADDTVKGKLSSLGFDVVAESSEEFLARVKPESAAE